MIQAKKNICVIGLGYIGLPTAAMFATHGHKVYGCDINTEVVDALNDHKIIIEEPYLDILVQAAVTSGNLIGSTAPKTSDYYIIAVPTPINENKTANMEYVVNATKSILPLIKRGDVVILESTSPVGTTDDLIVPILSQSGFDIGTDVFVGHSPERVLPGQILMELVNNNRIIGGINEASAVKIKELYSTFVKGEMFLTTSRTAEMCKLMENTYRDVNIALANELALISENYKINAWEVISLCNKHPRVNIHNPGPGVGGHCLAVDPWFIVQSSPNAKMISMAREINDSMPEHIFKCIQAELSHITGKKRICILGMSYKANVDDVRESPIIHLIKLMEKNKNYEVSVFDPHVKLKNMWLCDKLIDGCKNAHLLVLGVNHDCFKNIDLDLIGKVMEEKRILDTRNFFKQQSVESHGFTYRLFGKEA